MNCGARTHRVHLIRLSQVKADQFRCGRGDWDMGTIHLLLLFHYNRNNYEHALVYGDFQVQKSFLKCFLNSQFTLSHL